MKTEQKYINAFSKISSIKFEHSPSRERVLSPSSSKLAELRKKTQLTMIFLTIINETRNLSLKNTKNIFNPLWSMIKKNKRKRFDNVFLE